MIAIPMQCFQELCTALGRCKICAPEDRNSYILDRNDEKIGAINWHVPSVTIFADYEYADEVIESIGKGKFEDARQEFEAPKDEPVEITGDGVDLTDYGKQLYEMERDPNPELEYQISKAVKE